MRIVFSTDWYSEGVGYSENILPAAMARLGHDVHVVSSTMQVYGDHAFYREVYETFLGPPIVAPGRKAIGGVDVIRLPIVLWWKRFRVARGRVRTIVALKPDVVYAWDPRALQTLMLALAAPFAGFVLVTAVHTVGSIYPAYRGYAAMPWRARLRLRLTETLVGWLSTRRSPCCYANTPDAAEIAERFFGVRAGTIRHVPSGIDTTHFRPARTPDEMRARDAVRTRVGVPPGDVLCIYTGRLTEAKNPLCLARAVGMLREQGRAVSAVFLGEGEQEADIRAIAGCHVMPFVAYPDLPSYYRAADIGVWPRQESVSMTDAAACGLPIVVSDRLAAVERIDGNGLQYGQDDAADLAKVLLTLFDPERRRALGAVGVTRMDALFGIDRIAAEIAAEFERVVAGRRTDQLGPPA